ncbi:MULTISPECIES: DNA topoisomerase IV [Bizionia]|uniref:DNA topoisomerase IV n=1 Tax=Bizionia hallyeonensis TaxID=1123757 RepID=A0ABW0C5J7_9FLAO|nr:DNA topoisomerase IV [Bizionia sp. M204]UPS90973.1 DNA topoisomerase IV [Bizionia sp. M204]
MKLLLCVFLVLFMSCYQVERQCVDYQTGTYTSSITINDSTYHSVFTRTKDLQVETYKGHVDSTTVRWINDCEVVFRTINPKNMQERKDIHLKILTTTDSTYNFEYSYVGEKIKQKGTAKRID